MADSEECRACQWETACLASATILAVALATVPAFQEQAETTPERDQTLLPRSA